MWTYDKRLQYPINIKCANPRLAKVIISQYRRTRWRASSIIKISKPTIWNARPKIKSNIK